MSVIVCPSKTTDAFCRLLEQVHAAKQRRLARAGGADHDDDLPGLDLKVDALQHVEVPEPLVDAL